MSRTHREKENVGGDNDISSHNTIADDDCEVDNLGKLNQAVEGYFDETSTNALESFSVQDFAKVYLTATSKNCATEGVIQPLIHSWALSFQT